MTTYYCNGGGTWTPAQTGTDHAGNEWQGPYGLQKALDTVTAGNILHVKGTINLTRLVGMVLGKDVSGWSLGDAVMNDNGDGDDWTGVVCEISGTNILVELAIGDDEDDINIADGIENTTTPDTTTISSKSCNGLQCDTQAGSVASGIIKYIGVNSSWAIDGTKIVIDGNSDATNCIYLNVAYNWFQNIFFQNATEDNIILGSNGDYPIFIDCDITGAGDNGIEGSSSAYYPILIRCKIYSNSGRGILYLAAPVMAFCSVHSNGEDGFYPNSVDGGAIFASAFFDNGNNYRNLGTDSACVIINCILDGTNQSGETGYIPYTTTNSVILMLMNRITNNATGLNANDSMIFHGWNLYHNNTVDTANATKLYAIPHGSDTDTNKYDPDADDGYNDASSRDYNLKSSRTYNGDGNDTIGLGVGS